MTDAVGRIEWGYFTLFCDDGGIVSGALSATRTGCDLWLAVYGETPLALDRRHPRSELSLSAGEIRVHESALRVAGPELALRIRERGVELDVEARRLVEWENGHVRQLLRCGEVRWDIPGLRMSFSGRLSVNGRARDISGVMFHDRVGHDLRPSPHLLFNMREWLWGILYSRSRTLLFVAVDYRPRPFRFLCISDEQGTLSSNDGFRDSDFSFRPAERYPYAHYDISVRDERFRIHLGERHAVHHGGPVEKLASRLLRPKYHYAGTFSFRGEDGRAYLESFRFR